ncbi:MAG: DUF2209 family protein [Halobacteria archaeon]|nr:DUF2209 family protein [Halobacteria archaeon]
MSGRHEREDRYLMVCAAVSVELNPNSIDAVEEIKFDFVDTAHEPSFDVIVEVISNTVERITDDHDAVVVTEKGEFYNKPEWVVEGAIEHDFRYVETIGERKAVEVAHNAAYAARNLLLDSLNKLDALDTLEGLETLEMFDVDEDKDVDVDVDAEGTNVSDAKTDKKQHER